MARPGTRVAIETLGCKLNQADSDRLAERFAAAGYTVVAPDAAADVFVLNTCTITHVADRKARHTLRAARRRLPAAFIVATGCYVQRDGEAVAALPGVDLVAGNDHKRELVELVSSALGDGPHLTPGPSPLPMRGEERGADVGANLVFAPSATANAGGAPSAAANAVAAPSAAANALAAPSGIVNSTVAPSATANAVQPAPGNTRIFLAIQEGCNDVCSYCIVPRVRGRSRSVPAMTLVDQVRAATAAGAREVVLTGTQLGDYGLDDPRPRRASWTPPDGSRELLAKLLTRILNETEIPRLRVSSLQPQDITPALLQVWEDPRLCRHLHLPLQSGSDAVLAAMRRRYDRTAYLRAVELARAAIPGVALTADVIVGFPGETDDDFAATLELCRTAGLAALHVFPYSPREGTAAARYASQAPEDVKRARAEELLALGKQLSEDYRRGLIGTSVDVLWERPAAHGGVRVANGLTDTHVRVSSSIEGHAQGSISAVRIDRLYRDGVWGT